ncbi:MAG: YhcH/YjgK/YiaL family protein [Alphaproteobacteria bacterium]|uniref:YhcH/YjgK/YiaL family protein n=1 Tax=Candidatus Nitrobium versatile TaxID=2884831 RepID=A0A953JCA2_9BACT|nr:YhcH/YjgK/YiaL family protein [Candidatus Nitrobium versatile]
MIVDSIENFRRYCAEGSRLHTGFTFLLGRKEELPDGRYPIDGDDVFALVQTYETDLPGKKRFEGHRKYIDIQYLLSGKEEIGWAPVPGLEIASPYSEERDVLFFTESPFTSPLALVPGIFAVFFPEDAHRPGCVLSAPCSVRKIVVKVRV